MATKRYKDGDRLHAGVFNKLLSDVENLQSDVQTIEETMPTRTSELINDAGFITSETNTWRPIKVNNKEILGSEITTKPLNLLPGDGITIAHDNKGNVTITSTGGGGGGGTSYIAGDNIEINGNVISAIDTTYKASDFDIKDLKDTTGLRSTWSGKQDAIDDLETIRSGAALGATSIQSIPSEYVTDSELASELANYATTSALTSGLAAKQDTISDLDTIRSGAALGATALQSETDPTVPNWAKASKKPTYTAEEVGALSSDTYIPSKTSDLTNDSGYITGYTLPVATADDLGGIKIGDGLEIDGEGIVNVVGKQDTLTPGDNIEITSGGTINVTGITGVIESELEDLTLVISSNINELDERLVDVENGKQDTISDLDTIRSGAALGATALQSVPSEYVTDTELASGLATKQDTLTPGDNIEITSGGTINVTGITGVIDAELEGLTLVISSNINELDERLTDVESGKQDVLTAGENIEITSGGTINAIDTTYTASDFDIKDLSDSNDLRNEWSAKQDALTAGNNIEITSGGTISVTGITEPVASDFDIKDLADTTGLRDTWSSKQDAVSITVEEVIDFLNEPEPTPYELGYNAGKTDINYGDTPNPYTSGTTEHIQWQEGYEVGWEEEHPQPQPTPYELGYSAGTTDVNYGDTPNPYVSGTTEHTQWQEGYEVGWEETHPQPADELHFWFFNQADAEANNVTNDTDVFNSMWTGSMNNLSGSITIDGVTYTVTKRTGDKATFGNMIVPEGKVATFYALTVSSGGAARQLDLVSDNNTYNITVPGGSSSFSSIELSGIVSGTYAINRNGSGNFRFGMVAVKFTNAV